MKKIGLYFGSFNPIHLGHLFIAECLLKQTDLDEVWFVVSPQNPFKQKEELASQNHRLAMVELATSENEKLIASGIEFELTSPSYSVNTLKHLKENFPTLTFELIIGEDNLSSFNHWKDYNYILDNFHCYVYPRKDSSNTTRDTYTVLKEYPNSFTSIEAPLKIISATEIRSRIANGMGNENFLNEKVIDYIKANQLYIK